MATARMKGTDSVIARLLEIPAGLRGEVTREAVTAGAEVLRREIVAQAPCGSKDHGPKGGTIAENVILYERKLQDAYLQAEKDNLMSILVGPSKRAFHAYFVEHGTRAHVVRKSTRRALRIPTGKGVVFRKSAKIPATKPNPFLERAFQAARARAMAAMKQVYGRAVSRLGKANG